MTFHRNVQYLQHVLRRAYCTNLQKPQVAIVGSGPAGFYTAQQILKGNPHATVDIYDKLPVPFGLVRYGVAPDHPEVKNVINTFTKTANNERCNFLGNVTIGKDISIGDLREAYTAVVLAYGADEDKKLGLPGEDLQGVMAARSFVGWYNGLPQDAKLEPNLDTDTAVVLGQGNVAIDVARILLSPLDLLRKTDITEYALEALSKSRVKRVYLVGRRGPLQAAFTTAELREMVRLESCKPLFERKDFESLPDLIKTIPQKRRRLTQLMVKTALEDPNEKDAVRWGSATKEWGLKFLRSPKEFLSATDENRVCGVRFIINTLEGTDSESQRAVATDEIEDMPCGLVLRSIGYKSLPIAEVPFDQNSAVIPNEGGRVYGHKGLYCSGWVKRGPVGVIVSTMNDAFETGRAIIEDLANGHFGTKAHGKMAILPKLENKGVSTITFEDWMNIDAAEIKVGEKQSKLREKITDISKMVQCAKNARTK